jgi:hypothetical protein
MNMSEWIIKVNEAITIMDRACGGAGRYRREAWLTIRSELERVHESAAGPVGPICSPTPRAEIAGLDNHAAAQARTASNPSQAESLTPYECTHPSKRCPFMDLRCCNCHCYQPKPA